MILLIWQADKQDISGFAVTKLGQAPPTGREFQNLICSIRTKYMADTDICRKFEALGKGFFLPTDFESLSRAKKCQVPNEAYLRQGLVDEFPSLAAHQNTIRAFTGSLRPAASGAQSCLNYCGFVRRPPFPTQADTIAKWSGLFRHGRTFTQYLAHVAKSCILLHHPTDWMSPAIKSVARGLEAAHDLSFKFQNYIFTDVLLKLIKSAKLDNDFGLSCFFSFLLPLRVPSEALLMRRADDSDRITEFTHQN